MGSDIIEILRSEKDQVLRLWLQAQETDTNVSSNFNTHDELRGRIF